MTALEVRRSIPSCSPDYNAIVAQSDSVITFKDKSEGLECVMGVLTRESPIHVQTGLTAALKSVSEFRQVVLGYAGWESDVLRSLVRAHLCDDIKYVTFVDLTKPEGIESWKDRFEQLQSKAS